MSDIPAAVILAGGRSRRFDGQAKALLELGGKPLIEHVVDRLAPQVSCIALSVEKTDKTLEFLGLEQIEDPSPGAQGPLQALLAALQWVKARSVSQWLQLAPCETPFLPQDLTSQLISGARDSGLPGAVPLCDEQLQPACGVWNVELEGEVSEAVAAGKKGIKEFIRDHPLAVCAWTHEQYGMDPFHNINCAEDLRLAEKIHFERDVIV